MTTQHQIQMVRDWHIKYGAPAPTEPTPLSADRLQLRHNLIKEELEELKAEWPDGKRSALAKELADLQYVILGTYVEMGVIELIENTERIGNWNFDNFTEFIKIYNDVFLLHGENLRNAMNYMEDMWGTASRLVKFLALEAEWPSIFAEVHRSNMSKGTNGRPIKRADGKILKGEDYVSADLTWLDETATTLLMTDNELGTVKEYAAHLQEENPQCRKGQAFFNALHETHPHIANMVRGTKYDPFYSDKKLEGCYQFLLTSKIILNKK